MIILQISSSRVDCRLLAVVLLGFSFYFLFQRFGVVLPAVLRLASGGVRRQRAQRRGSLVVRARR